VVGAPKNELLLTGDKIRMGATNVYLLFAEGVTELPLYQYCSGRNLYLFHETQMKKLTNEHGLS